MYSAVPGRGALRDRQVALGVAEHAEQRGDADAEQFNFSRRRSPSAGLGLVGGRAQADAGRRGQVAVDDAAAAGDDQRVADLVGEGGDVGPRQRALGADHRGERVAVEQLHHVVAEVVGGAAAVEDLDEVLAAQRVSCWASWRNWRARGSAGE
jgi:hypothetical protein